MKKFHLTTLVIFILTSNGCRSIVNPGEWVVSTATCWNTISVTKAGDYVPKLYQVCDRMIILPATFMAADFMIETKFKNRVAGTVNLTYQWRIVDPIKFVYNAKNVLSCPTDGDKKINPDALEAVENSVVDKMVIDAIREYTPNKPALTDELEIEKDIFRLCMERFSDRGIEFASMSVNVNFSVQTEEALDVISALNLYEETGEKEFGKEVIKAKAGASVISTTMQSPIIKDEE